MESYDFYTMGVRHGTESTQKLMELAKKIEEKYGKDARMEFEVGTSIALEKFIERKKEILSEKNVSKATTNYGVYNSRNNSYFGGKGTGKQYEYSVDGGMSYIEPKSAKKR